MFITTKKTHTIAPFDPETTRDNLAKADAAIAFAAKIKNWPLLEEAIDAKIADQEEFVRWWGEAQTNPAPAAGPISPPREGNICDFKIGSSTMSFAARRPDS